MCQHPEHVVHHHVDEMSIQIKGNYMTKMGINLHDTCCIREMRKRKLAQTLI